MNVSDDSGTDVKPKHRICGVAHESMGRVVRVKFNVVHG
jgi:hypothetical protein